MNTFYCLLLLTFPTVRVQCPILILKINDKQRSDLAHKEDVFKEYLGLIAKKIFQLLDCRQPMIVRPQIIIVKITDDQLHQKLRDIIESVPSEISNRYLIDISN